VRAVEVGRPILYQRGPRRTGLSDEKLLAIHAHYLGPYTSENPRMKAIRLKALDMAYRLKGVYAPERHRIESEPHIPTEALELRTRNLRWSLVDCRSDRA
jgi:hypothetical protein